MCMAAGGGASPRSSLMLKIRHHAQESLDLISYHRQSTYHAVRCEEARNRWIKHILGGQCKIHTLKLCPRVRLGGRRIASFPVTTSPTPQTLFHASRLVEPSCCPLTLWLSIKQDLTQRPLCACLLPSVAGLWPVRVVAGGREAPGFSSLAPGPIP